MIPVLEIRQHSFSETPPARNELPVTWLHPGMLMRANTERHEEKCKCYRIVASLSQPWISRKETFITHFILRCSFTVLISWLDILHLHKRGVGDKYMLHNKIPGPAVKNSVRNHVRHAIMCYNMRGTGLHDQGSWYSYICLVNVRFTILVK